MTIQLMPIHGLNEEALNASVVIATIRYVSLRAIGYVHVLPIKTGIAVGYWLKRVTNKVIKCYDSSCRR